MSPSPWLCNPPPRISFVQICLPIVDTRRNPQTVASPPPRILLDCTKDAQNHDSPKQRTDPYTHSLLGETMRKSLAAIGMGRWMLGWRSPLYRAPPSFCPCVDARGACFCFAFADYSSTSTVVESAFAQTSPLPRMKAYLAERPLRRLRARSRRHAPRS